MKGGDAHHNKEAGVTGHTGLRLFNYLNYVPSGKVLCSDHFFTLTIYLIHTQSTIVDCVWIRCNNQLAASAGKRVIDKTIGHLLYSPHVPKTIGRPRKCARSPIEEHIS